MEQALAGVRVVDLAEGTAGAYCAKLLAGFGADVVRVEPPEGVASLRDRGPHVEGDDGQSYGIPYLWLGTGKRSVSHDDARVERLLARADVVVLEGGHHASDAQRLRKEHPHLVVLSIRDFGDGPYADYVAGEMQLQALSGMMHMTGGADRPPLSTGPDTARYSAGLNAYSAVLMALHRGAREGGAAGCLIELTVFESAIENVENAVAGNLLVGKVARRGGHAFAPWGLFAGADGWVAVVGAPFRKWNEGRALFEEPGLLDPKFAHVTGRVAHHDELDALLQPWLSRHPVREIFREAQARGMAFGYAAPLPEAMESDHHAARGFLKPVDGVTGQVATCDAPYQMAATPWRTTAAPRIAAHDAEIESELDAVPAREGSQAGDAQELPLAGIRVVDLTHSWAGPHATRRLADYGAEVIRVEYPRRLCMFRGGKTENRVYDDFPGWIHLNRNKRSIALDLAKPEDAEVLRDLVKQADVFVENARPGVMKRLGFGYDELARLKSDIVMVSMSAFGATGPLSGYVGYGATLETVGGIQSLTSYEDGPPQRIREMDVINGVAAAGAILTALVHRDRSGKGQHVDLSQLEASSHALVGEHFLEQALTGDVQVRRGNHDPARGLDGCYPCAGEDRWVTISVHEDDAWSRFCDAVGEAGWRSDARFATEESRRANRAELDALVADWTRGRTPREAMEALQAHGIRAAAVLDPADLAQDPHLRARGYFVDGVEGSHKEFLGTPFRFNGHGGRIWRRGPRLDEDSAYVRCELLGRGPETVVPLQESELGTAFDPE